MLSSAETDPSFKSGVLDVVRSRLAIPCGFGSTLRTRTSGVEVEASGGSGHSAGTAQLREQFIAVLGHDLRNPLAAISAGARILQRSGALQEPKELRILDMINSTVTRMSDLIDDILDFARGRLGGGITLHRDAKPIEPVLEQVVDELRTASPQRLIQTDFEINEPVDCDRARIGQLASNLIGNALTHGAPDQPVRMGARTEGGTFRLWVANCGEPIPGSRHAETV